MSVLRSLVIAFACFSKLPMPRVDWEPRAMRYSMCFFPLIGLVIGLIIWGWLALAAWLDLGVLLRATGVLLVSLAVTGGIHMHTIRVPDEDALKAIEHDLRDLGILVDESDHEGEN